MWVVVIWIMMLAVVPLRAAWDWATGLTDEEADDATEARLNGQRSCP